ncbi:hypothetical protein AAF712_010659 [Marasmius tenuissimus]|uniref:Uncharacterized protein n=1 Tax=Marasmius tenuissimus TaxID=585030 RepID=A0ABR2ZLA2_9AGAR
MLDKLLVSLAAPRRAEVDVAYHVAEKYQYIESYQYATMMATLGGLSTFVKQDTPSLGYRLLPMQQPTVAPYQLSHLHSIRNITNCSPDIALMLYNILTVNGRRQAGLDEIALAIMEIKRLAGGTFSLIDPNEGDIRLTFFWMIVELTSNYLMHLQSQDIAKHEKRDFIPWQSPEAQIKALKVLEGTLSQIFTQAICTSASYKSQKVLHHFFICGSYFSVLVFKRRTDFDALLQKYHIHHLVAQGGGTAPVNITIDDEIIIDFFFSAEAENRAPAFTTYNTQLFKFSGPSVEPSMAFCAALKDALDAHGVELMPLNDPFLSLEKASVEESETSSLQGEGLLQQWLANHRPQESEHTTHPSDESSDGYDSTKDPAYTASSASTQSSPEPKTSPKTTEQPLSSQAGPSQSASWDGIALGLETGTRKRGRTGSPASREDSQASREDSPDPLEANTAKTLSPPRKRTKP